MSKRWSARLAGGFVAMSTAVALAACGTPGASSPGAPAASEGGGTAGGAPYKVGLVYSKTGALAAYGAQYQASFKVGLDYATKGTNAVNGQPVEVTEADDAGDPAKAVTAATSAIGAGAKIIAGSTASGVALQVAPLAEGEQGPVHLRTGRDRRRDRSNKYTFRSGRQTYQDIATAGDDRRRPHRQEGHRLRAGQRVRQGQRGRRQGGPRRQGGDRRLGAGAAVGRHRLHAVRPAGEAAKPGSALRRLGRRQRARDVARRSTQQGVFDARPRWSPASHQADAWPSSARPATRSTFLSHFFAGAAEQRRDQALASRPQEGWPGRRPVHRRRLRRGADGRPGAERGRRRRRQDGHRARGLEVRRPKGQPGDPAADHALLQPMFRRSWSSERLGLRPAARSRRSPRPTWHRPRSR